MALPHPYGRLQFGDDLDLTFRTLAGQGRNPNCAAAIVIGIEPVWTDRIVKEIAKTGKPSRASASSGRRPEDDRGGIPQGQGVRTIRDRAHARAFAISQLCMSTKCGESDTTSGLAANPTVGRAFERLADAGATLISAKPPK